MIFDKERLVKLTDIYSKKINNETVNDFSDKNLYNDLIEIVNFHNYLYYVEASPIISDYEYDLFFSVIKDFEVNNPSIIDNNSPTQKLTFQLQSEFTKAEHKFSILSLQNSYSSTDLFNWNEFIMRGLKKNNHINQYSFVVEPKFDGSSIELIYNNGKLTQAITRGDGYIGEDITENVKAISIGVPLKLKGKNIKGELRIRGEIVMPKSSLERINAEKLKNSEQIFANTRNATAGTLRNLDPNITKKRGLICYVYEILNINERSELSGTDHENILNQLQIRGFNVFSWRKHLFDIDSVVKVCENMAFYDYLDGQNIEFDGLVIKINELNIRDILGTTNHHPRWAIAYKYPAKQVSTKLVSVNYSIGRTGVITPVAIFEPIKIGGVLVSKASLHNFDYIKEKDIKINDYVWIQRSGEVIPYVLGPIIERRTGSEYEILPPQKCPYCDVDIIKLENDVFYRCININCSSVLKEKIAHFVSKNAMNIDGLGEKIVDLLVDSGVIKHFSDIYFLSKIENRVKVSSLPGMGSKRVSELFLQIELSKKNSLRRLLHGLGIQEIGIKMSKELEQQIYNNVVTNRIPFESFNSDYLIQLLSNIDFLNSIYGIGEKTILSIHTYLKNVDNQKIISELEIAGVKFNVFETVNKSYGPLKGIKFSITGNFIYKRSEIISIIEKYGGQYDDNISSSTNFLLKGDGGSSKISKANDLSIKIINGTDDLISIYPFLNVDFKNINQTKKPKDISLF